MGALAPLAVTVPLVVAALLMAFEKVLPRWLVDAAGACAGAATAGACLALAAASRGGPIVYWFGGWRPRGGAAVGIPFVVEPLGAGMAALAAVLVLAGLVFSVRYFEAVGSLYHALVLLMLAGMVGFALTGDLFSLFVFFELTGVAAYALTGYRSESSGPLQGALSFAVTNTVAGSLTLVGIGLLYARCGSLAFAGVGRALAARPADALVAVAFTLTAGGMLAKAGAVPFHFAHADAHTVAPTPVLAAFSGAMLPLALLGLARLYWSVFAPALPPGSGVSALLLAAGAVSAVLAAVMCFAQRNLKRLLAFSTLSHVGLFLVGIGLLVPAGLAGVGVYVVGHGLVKATLFLAAGVLLHRFESSDELDLAGRGRELRVLGALFLLAAAGLVGLPPFPAALGKSMIEEAARQAGIPWVSPLLFAVSAITGGAVLRVGARVFLGWGPARDELAEATQKEGDEEDEPESGGPSGRTPWVMVAPLAGLLALALAAGLAPGWIRAVEDAAHGFTQPAAVAARVLDGAGPAPPSAPERPLHRGWPKEAATLVAAAALALAALLRHRFRTPSAVAAARRPLLRALAGLERLHSGHVGDYVTWLTVGVAVLGAAAALALR